jgi:hypothetical protein
MARRRLHYLRADRLRRRGRERPAGPACPKLRLFVAAAFGSAAARLMRAYATQVEVLRRLRNGWQQFVRVEHVHVNDGGQAVTGNVKKQGEQD